MNLNTSPQESNILLVEDDKSTIEILSILLYNKGYRVRKVSNGKEALTYLKKKSYEIIITDLNMPDMDGYQLLDTVKTSFREHKVLVMSADLPMRESLLRKGALEAFDKPFELDEFVEELGRLLRERRKSKRFTSKQEIQCFLKDKKTGNSAEGILIDISIDGALIKTNKVKGKLKEVAIDFILPESMRIFLKVNGKVTRKEKGKTGDWEIGIYFNADRDISFMDALKPFIRQKD
jgi:CheY-like chemotaxis protein